MPFKNKSNQKDMMHHAKEHGIDGETLVTAYVEEDFPTLLSKP